MEDCYYHNFMPSVYNANIHAEKAATSNLSNFCTRQSHSLIHATIDPNFETKKSSRCNSWKIRIGFTGKKLAETRQGQSEWPVLLSSMPLTIAH